ncbi:polymorphic outer membrane protein repeat-containing protein [Orenia metallireducens]|uniref:Polymorphic outer membrane protein repeat-containing protein n=1 Tax=Orenia metallireducens TaxID=1413210 RepID=A0A285G972_9FIRM|nr:NifB/NifX family molybdenum-iron cluster-binding protein [Orenia metallireducens]SNY19674.1 polymorphic outer membrane protein repeat-containing protein [Orenia metallireducens]
MKVAVTASNNTDLNVKIDPKFGRAPYFTIIDFDNDKVSFIDNSAKGATGGAGIQAAQTIVDQGVEGLITGNVGPKAFNVLSKANIKVYSAKEETIKEVLSKYKNNDLKEVAAPTNNGHAGM